MALFNSCQQIFGNIIMKDMIKPFHRLEINQNPNPTYLVSRLVLKVHCIFFNFRISASISNIHNTYYIERAFFRSYTTHILLKDIIYNSHFPSVSLFWAKSLQSQAKKKMHLEITDAKINFEAAFIFSNLCFFNSHPFLESLFEIFIT